MCVAHTNELNPQYLLPSFKYRKHVKSLKKDHIQNFAILFERTNNLNPVKPIGYFNLLI